MGDEASGSSSCVVGAGSRKTRPFKSRCRCCLRTQQIPAISGFPLHLYPPPYTLSLLSWCVWSAAGLGSQPAVQLSSDFCPWPPIPAHITLIYIHNAGSHSQRPGDQAGDHPGRFVRCGASPALSLSLRLFPWSHTSLTHTPQSFYTPAGLLYGPGGAFVAVLLWCWVQTHSAAKTSHSPPSPTLPQGIAEICYARDILSEESFLEVNIEGVTAGGCTHI